MGIPRDVAAARPRLLHASRSTKLSSSAPQANSNTTQRYPVRGVEASAAAPSFSGAPILCRLRLGAELLPADEDRRVAVVGIKHRLKVLVAQRLAQIAAAN